MGRVGNKRSDHRWRAPDGTIWPSELEYNVYAACLQDERINVRACDERDTFSYATKVRSGRCTECGSSQCVQDRTYQPDLYIWTTDEDNGFFVEVKGFMRAARRSQIAALLRQSPTLDLRFVIGSSKTRATKKLLMWEYIEKYYKRPWIEWSGQLPETWINDTK